MRSIRVNKPQDVKRVLTQLLNEIRADEEMDKVHRGRLICYISTTLLTALKDGDLEDRMAAIERQLKEDEQ
jgi:hypothetical protein